MLPSSSSPSTSLQAERLLAAGELDAADAAFRAVLAEAPDSVSAFLGLAACARKRKDRAAALAFYRSASRLAPARAGLHLEIGDELRALDRYEEAEAAYGQAVALAPDLAAARRGLALCLRKRGAAEAALAQARAAALLKPKHIAILSDIAELLHGLGAPLEAVELYERAAALAPTSIRPRAALAECARQRGDHAAALAQHQALAGLEPQNVRWLLNAFEDLRTLGRHEEGTAVLAAAAAAPANRRLISYLRARHGRPAAMDHCRNVLNTSPDATDLRLELASDLRVLGHLDEAETEYRRILANLPENAEALSGLGHCARQRGDRARAMAWFEEAARAAPGAIRPMLEICNELREVGATETARAQLDNLAAAHPHDVPVLLARAALERQLYRHETARDLYLQAAQLAPGNPNILVELAIEEKFLGAPQRCASYVAAALAINPSHPGAIKLAAEFSHAAGDHEHALKLYLAAIAAQPSDPGLQSGLAETLNLLGRTREAEAHLAALEEQFGLLPQFRAKRISLLRRAGHFDEALTLARQSVRTMPNQFDLTLERFRCEYLVGDSFNIAQALAGFTAGAARANAARLAARAAVAESRAQFGTARRLYKAALLYSPHDASYHHDLARAEMLEFDLDAAAASLRQEMKHSNAARSLNGRSSNVSQSLFGQILDEYRMDGELKAKLLSLHSVPPAPRAAALLELMTTAPEHTGVAVALFVAMRQAGALRPGRPAPGASIPRRIMQFWDTAPPPEVAEIMASWREHNPTHELVLFDERMANDYLARYFPPPVRSAFQRCREAAQKADLFRLAWLWREGGIYADADDRCLRPLAAILPEETRLAVYQEDIGSIGNNFIAVTPGHRVLALALQGGVAAVNRGDSDLLWLSTGPGLLTRAFAAFLAETGSANALPDGTLVLHRREMYRAVAMHSFVGYKRSKKHWNRANFTNRNSFPSLEQSTPAAADAAGSAA